MGRLLAGGLLEQAVDLPGFGVPACGFLAVDQLVVHYHLEPAAVRGDECEGCDGRREVCQQLFRQTDGSRPVVSHLAVFDADRVLVHGLSPQTSLSPAAGGSQLYHTTCRPSKVSQTEIAA